MYDISMQLFFLYSVFIMSILIVSSMNYDLVSLRGTDMESLHDVIT